MDMIIFTPEDVEKGYKIVTSCCYAAAKCKHISPENTSIDYCYCNECKRVISINNDTPDIKVLVSPKEPQTMLRIQCTVETKTKT